MRLKDSIYDLPDDFPELPEGFEWKVSLEPDYDYDTSCLGDAVRHAPHSGWYVDRSNGVLLNSVNDETYSTLYIGHRYDEHYHMRWVKLGENHQPPGEGWAHVPDETQEKTILEHGSLYRCDVQAMLEDHKWLEQYWSGDINVYHWAVELYFQGEEVAIASLGGVTSEDDYWQEVVRDLADECITNFLKDDEFWLVHRLLADGTTVLLNVPFLDEKTAKISEKMLATSKLLEAARLKLKEIVADD